MPTPFVEFFVFLFGAVIGSFLNVCIYRLPEELSIVTPRSFCPSCKKTVAWYDNIPMISFCLLRGKCRECGAKISFQYFLVEFLTACMFLVIYAWFGLSIVGYVNAVFICALIVISFIDLKYQIIPDCISLPGIVLGILLSMVFPQLHHARSWMWGGIWSVAGMLTGGGMILLTKLLGDFCYKRESMGGGDIKLLAMIGAFFGWKLTVLTYFLAPFFGAGVGLVMKYKYKQDVIPYGPFLSLGAVTALLWGQEILSRYFIFSGL